MPFLGEILPLSFQLLDSDASKFCRAIVTDPTGTPIVGSPVTMVSIGGGKYSADSITMPNLDYLEVTYEPFNDAGFTIPDPDHLVGTDVFRLEVPDSVIVDKLDLILFKLANLAATDLDIKVSSDIQDVIVEVQKAKALVERDDIKSILTTQGSAKVEVDSNSVIVTDDC